MFPAARRRLILPFLLPQALLYTVFTAVPLLATVALALTNWSGVRPLRFVGLENFRLLLSDPAFRRALGNSLYYVAAGAVFLFAPAYWLAWCLSQSIRLKALFRFLVLAPVVLSVSVAGLMWKWVFHPVAGFIGGPLQTLGRALEFEPFIFGLLRHPDTALTIILLVHLWHSLGTWVLLILAGFERLPPELTDAARVDGAGEWQVFWRITLPLQWDLFRVVLVLWIMAGLQAFSFVYVMGRASVMATYVYSVTFGDWRWAYGMALATAMLVLIFMASMLTNRVLLRETVET